MGSIGIFALRGVLDVKLKTLATHNFKVDY